MRSTVSFARVLAGMLAGSIACAPDQVSSPEDRGSSAVSQTTAASTRVDSNLALSDNGGGCFAPLITADPTDLTTLINLVNPEWAPVVKGTNPFSAPVLLHGTAVESHVSKEDFPAAHVNFDQNTELLLEGPDTRFLATGNPDDTLELEWETGSYPAWAWAGIGDRVVALGRWIFDCGHPDPFTPGLCHGTTRSFCLTNADCTGGAPCEGAVFSYRSEMHPPQATAVIRSGRGGILEEDEDEDGEGHAVPVTRADVFVSADGGGAGDACVVTHRPSAQAVLFGPSCFPLQAPLAPLNARDFTFELPLPKVPRGRDPELRVLPQLPIPTVAGLPPVAARFESRLAGPEPHFEVTVRMTEPVRGTLPTGFAATFLAGWRHAPRSPLVHLRVTVDGVLVQNALKPAVPGLDKRDIPAGWKLQANVNGEWQEIQGLEHVSAAGTFPVHATFDQFLPRAATLRIHADASSTTCVSTLFAHSLLEDLIRFGFNPADRTTLQAAIARGQRCLADRRELDAGEVDVAFQGPRFGVRDAPYEVVSSGGAAAYKLRFRIQRVEDAGERETADLRMSMPAMPGPERSFSRSVAQPEPLLGEPTRVTSSSR